jgi:hypothetical protein
MDVRRTEARAQALDSDLSTLWREVVEPLSTATSKADDLLSRDYAIDAQSLQEVSIPFLAIASEGEVFFLCQVGVQRSPDGLRVDPDPTWGPVFDVLDSRVSAVVSSIPVRGLTDADKAEVGSSLQRLAAQGRIDPSLLENYLLILNLADLKVSAGGQVDLGSSSAGTSTKSL